MSVDDALPPHGGQLQRIAERFGVPVAGLLDFSVNINPEGPSLSAMDALHQALKDPAILTAYPDLEEVQLRLAISSYAGVAPDMVAVANGFVPLLNAALRVFPMHRCLLPVPAFVAYRSALEEAGVQVTPFRLDQALDFRYQPDRLLAELRNGRHDSVLLANPQNPSGVLCDGSVLSAFLTETEKLKVRVLLDEAFIDYAPAHSMVKEAARFANLVVFRSVTKFYGCPGLRVAYAVAQGSKIRKIHQSLAPWAITSLAAIAVRASLADSEYGVRTRKLNWARRETLRMRLDSVGLSTYPAAANFVLVRFRSIGEAANSWNCLVRDHGMVLRHCGNFEGLAQDHLRCAVLRDEENSRLIPALHQLQGLRRAPAFGQAAANDERCVK